MDMTHSRRRNEVQSVAEQAAEWLLILEDAAPEEREAFSSWIAESPLHVEAFLRASTMDTLLSRVDPQRSIPLERMPLPETEHDILPSAKQGRFTSAVRSERFDRRVVRALAAGVALAAITSIGLWQVSGLWSGRWQHYRTTIGEQRVLELDDGSLLHMNTDSSIDVLFSASERRIRLTAGEAMFRVQSDPQRPFRVFSGESVIQAIGTQFNVNRTRSDAVVAVIEGAVQISSQNGAPSAGKSTTAANDTTKPIRLTAGEQARITEAGAITTPKPVDVSRVNAWRQRRLIFVDDPLSWIASEFNRYNRAPKIVIEDMAIAGKRYAAAFDVDDPESLLTVLEKDPALQIERRPDELVIRRRTQ